MASRTKVLAIVMVAAVTVGVACTAKTPRAKPFGSSSASPHPTTTASPAALVPPEPPDAETPAAGVCPTLAGDTAAFILFDTAQPRCGRVTGGQHLRITNATSQVATFFFASTNYSLSSGATITFTTPFDDVFQPGVHELQTSVYAGSGPVIWLLAPAVSGRAPACTAQQLRLLLSQPISEATGQHTTIFAVRNVSATDCYLNGYPSISLLDRNGRIVSFTYHDGGDQMLTSNRPGRVGLVPGGYSYFAINKYRCDRGALSAGTTILAGIPGSAKQSLRSGISVDYCGPGDPGTLVSVSPFEINYMGLIHG